MSYPEIIDAAELSKQAHISDAEVARDIADTEAEVAQWQQTAEAQRRVADTLPIGPERKMADFRASGYAGRVEQGRTFIAYLRRLQSARAATRPSGEHAEGGA